MASRSSRSSAKEPLSTPGVKKERAHSPLSPTKVSRTEEKKQLGHLNDRLAAYIDRVRSLELENGKLEKKIYTLEETSTREVTSFRNNFENEISQIRAALDQTSKENARLTMEVDKAKLVSREATERVKTKEDEVMKLSRSNKMLDSERRDLAEKLDSATTELRDLRPESENLKNKLADARQKLEDETLKRIDLQNQLQTKAEETEFNYRVLEQQLNETKTMKQMEIEEVDSRAQQNYDEQLAASLRDLRATYEQQMSENRSGFSAVYDKKISDLNTKLTAERGAAASAVQEMKEMQTRTEGMSSRVCELESTNSALQRRIKELSDQIDEIGRINRADMARKDHEIDYLNEQLTNLTQEYQELLEIKIALDMEIAAYQKLLDGEELRLGLSPEKPQSGRGTKRRRMDVEESYISESHDDVVNCPGPYYIETVDKEKNNIQVKNVGTEELNLGGMVLKCQSEGLESQYKFTRSHKIPVGGTITVWSSDSGIAHSVAEGQLVMKTGAWKMGDAVTVLLLNKEGDQEGMRDVNLNVTSSDSFRSSEVPSSPASVRAARQVESEKCVIM